MNFLFLVSRQGKVRLSKWYNTFTAKDKARITREVTSLVLNRPPKMCNFVEYKEHKIVYRRYVVRVVRACSRAPFNPRDHARLASSRALPAQLRLPFFHRLRQQGRQ